MNVCRRFLQGSVICQFVALLSAFAMISMPTSYSQAQAPQCQVLFMSDQVIVEKLKALANTQAKIRAGEYDRDIRMKNDLELNLQTQFTGLVRTFGSERFQRLLAQARGSVNTKEVQAKQEKRNEKEFKIEVVSVLEKLLTIEKDDKYNDNVIQSFKNTDIKYRKLVSDKIVTEWLNSDHGSTENIFSMWYLDILKAKIYEGNVQKIQELFDLEMFDVNSQNESGFSILMQASYADQQQVIDWILKDPKFNISKKNDFGFTDVEQLRLLGKSEIANNIEAQRPGPKSRKFEVKERNVETTVLYRNGTPIRSFVQITPGKFKMDYGKNKISVTLTKPFAIMSTQTTQKMWRELVELANQYLPGKYELDPDPSRFKGDQNPVEKVSHDDVVICTKALNELSLINDSQLQQALAEIFPGHKKGAIYRLPTETEWEYVARLGGLANGDYSHGTTDKNLTDYAWFYVNSRSTTHPVGLKKPIMINGEPIYDIHGNVWEWMADWYQENLTGGEDPQGPVTGSRRALRGGGWEDFEWYLRSAGRGGVMPGGHDSRFGFRLVRVDP